MNSNLLFFTVFLVACLMAPTGASGNMLGIHEQGTILRASTGVTLEISPSSSGSIGQVNVTFTIHNVERLFCWQIGVNCTSVTFITATLPPDDIFAGQNAVGLINGTAHDVTALGNCLIGTENANGTAPLVQATFEVTHAPQTFTLSKHDTFFLDSDLNDINYSIMGE